MSKRPLTQLQDEPEPVASKSTKSEYSSLIESLRVADSELASLEAEVRSREAETRSREAELLQEIYVLAMSQGKIKAAPDLDWCKRLIENNPIVQNVLHKAVGERSFEAITSLGR